MIPVAFVDGLHHALLVGAGLAVASAIAVGCLLARRGESSEHVVQQTA